MNNVHPVIAAWTVAAYLAQAHPAQTAHANTLSMNSAYQFVNWLLVCGSIAVASEASLKPQNIRASDKESATRSYVLRALHAHSRYICIRLFWHILKLWATALK